MKKILIAVPVTEEQKEEFQKIALDYELVFEQREQVTKEQVMDSEAIIGNISPVLLADAKGLKWLQLNSAGTDAYTKEGILPKGVKLTSASGAYGVAVSEHMLSMTLMLQKKLHLYLYHNRDGLWQDEGMVTSLTKSHVLVFGTGDIGSEYAKRMQLLGSKVYGMRRKVTEVPEYFDGVYSIESLEDILPKMDIVAVTLPGSDELYHLFDKATFSLMKKGCIFINAGRGSLVDQEALLEALEKRQIFAAGLDVTEPEPLLKDSPLWQCRHILITPHVAGGYHLQITLDKIIELAQKNLREYLNKSAIMEE